MQDSTERHPDSLPVADRRIYARKRCDALLYVALGEDNGGIVLNLGEDGLEFHAAMGLRQSHFPKIRFQLPLSGRWAEAGGELAWVNEAGTTGGLKFANLPEQARAEIQDWIVGREHTVEAQQAIEKPVEKPWTVPAMERPSILPREVETFQQEAVELAIIEVEHSEINAGRISELPAEKPQPMEAAELESATVAAGPSAQPAKMLPEVAETDDEELLKAAGAAQESIAREDFVTAVSATRSKDGAGSPGALSEPFARSFEWQGAGEGTSRRSLSTGGLVALLVTVAAASFAAGMATGNGTLRAWIHASEHSLETKAAQPASSTPEKDASVPAAQTPPTTTRGVTSPVPNPPSMPAHNSSGAMTAPAAEGAARRVASAQAAMPAASVPNATPPPVTVKPEIAGGNETIDLPEEPISASSTIAMSVTRSVEAPAPANGGARETAAHVLPGEVTSHAEPEYPATAIEQQVEGTVKLLVTISKEGAIQQIEPMGGPPALVGPSVAAVQRWRFNPTFLNGRPVSVQAVVEIVFRLPAVETSPANP